MQRIKGNLVGLSILAILVTLASLPIPESEIPKIFWIFIYLGLAFCALFSWSHRAAPSYPKQWLLLSLYSVAAAFFWLLIASLASRIIFQGIEHPMSKFFDIGVAMLISPGCTFILLSGWARALFLQHG